MAQSVDLQGRSSRTYVCCRVRQQQQQLFPKRTESFWERETKAVERMSLKTIHDEHKHEKESQVFWCLITTLQNGHYHMWLSLFSQLCWFHQNFWQCWRKRLPETHIVRILFKINAIISTLYPTSWNRKHWISVWNERQDLETSDGWRNGLALECFKSFILLLRNGGSLQVLVYKKPNKPSVYKAGSIFIFTLLNQEEATVMKKKLLSLTNKEHFNRLTSTIL